MCSASLCEAVFGVGRRRRLSFRALLRFPSRGSFISVPLWTPMLAFLCAITFALASIERGFSGLGRFRTQNLNTVFEAALRLALALVLLALMQRPASRHSSHI